jgi:hypothetical protein
MRVAGRGFLVAASEKLAVQVQNMVKNRDVYSVDVALRFQRNATVRSRGGVMIESVFGLCNLIDGSSCVWSALTSKLSTNFLRAQKDGGVVPPSGLICNIRLQGNRSSVKEGTRTPCHAVRIEGISHQLYLDLNKTDGRCGFHRRAD